MYPRGDIETDSFLHARVVRTVTEFISLLHSVGSHILAKTFIGKPVGRLQKK